MDPQAKRNSGTSADLPENVSGCLRVRWTTHLRSRLKTSRPPVLAPPSCARARALKRASALDDDRAGAEDGEESTRHPVGSRKRKWTNELDALLLREVKLHKPHGKRHGRKGIVYEIIAGSLNESERLPWSTDKKHLQGRVQHLLEARRSNQRATERVTGIEEEYGELEIILDHVIEEADTFKSTEMKRREVRRD
jgi:hypothetical protein